MASASTVYNLQYRPSYSSIDRVIQPWSSFHLSFRSPWGFWSPLSIVLLPKYSTYLASNHRNLPAHDTNQSTVCVTVQFSQSTRPVVPAKTGQLSSSRKTTNSCTGTTHFSTHASPSDSGKPNRPYIFSGLGSVRKEFNIRKKTSFCPSPGSVHSRTTSSSPSSSALRHSCTVNLSTTTTPSSSP